MIFKITKSELTKRIKIKSEDRFNLHISLMTDSQ